MLKKIHRDFARLPFRDIDTHLYIHVRIMDELLNDPRFAHIPKDPKFRRIPKSERKVKIDKRFQAMFTDKRFIVKYTIDKRGRPINQTSTENLKKFYDLSSSEDESDEDEDNEIKELKSKPMKKDEKKNLKNNEDKQIAKEECLKAVKPNQGLTKPREKNESKLDEDHDELSQNDIDDGNDKNTNIHIKDDNNDGDDDDKSNDDESGYEESDDLNERESSVITNLDLKENEKQLSLRVKGESSKLEPVVKKKLRDLTIDYARGEEVLISDSSSSEEESSESEEDDEDIEHDWGEMDKDAERTDEVTSRLAACNMDWDRIRAVDLMVLFTSFLPVGGLIHSVTIYLSEFGLQRMKEEETKGPLELIGADDLNADSDEQNEEENEEGLEFHMEKMRQYQLNRLKYYYAVVAFDTPESANKIYTECDGIEYESTATKLDLRFIPHDMEFNQEVKDFCDKLPEVLKYQPRQFTTTALQQAKVELTWDETKPERTEIARRLNSGKLDDIDDNDIQAYLASGTSDESEAEVDNKNEDDMNPEESIKAKDNKGSGDSIEKYKALLKSIEEQEVEKKKKDVELEVTWGLGIKKKTEKFVKERMKKKDNLTPFEQYLEKRKEKQKAKREKRLKSKDTGEGSSNDQDSESDDSVPSDVDMNDPYFVEEMKNMKPKSEGKKKNKKGKAESEDEEAEQRKSELELLMLDKDDDGKHHFDMKKIEENEMLSKSKKKRLSKKKKQQLETAVEDSFKVNVNDPRFFAIFNSHHFNIDPADHHYRKTKGTEALVKEKLKRRANEVDNHKEDSTIKQMKKVDEMSTELAALVKKVKRNTENIKKRIK